MYHIKEDKRSQKSAKLICEGFDLCLEKKDFLKITVADVLNKSTVGRATFYRLFDSLSDVLVYKCDLIFEDIANKFSKLQSEKIEDIFIFFISKFIEQDKLLEAIVSANRLDILYDSYRKQADFIRDMFKIDVVLSEDEIDYLIAIATSAIIGMLDIWIKHNKKESASELFIQVKKHIGIFYNSLQNNI